MRLLTRSVVLVLLACMTLCGSASVHAQSGKSGLAVSPPTFELSANPGDILTNSMRVDNVVTEPLEVSVDTRNFSALGEEGGINLSQSEDSYSLASWITVTPAKMTIQPGQSATFDYRIAIPANASPGGRFGSIIFKTAPRPVSNQSGVAVGQEVGALVFLKIAGQVDERAEIVSFASSSVLHERGPVGFDIRVRNQGNVQLKPTGTITVSNFFGKKVATVDVAGENVLPGAIRKMQADWKGGWLFGRYNATVSMVYGNDRHVITASTAFWAFPYKVAGLILLVTAIVVGVLYPRRKRFARAFKILFGRD